MSHFVNQGDRTGLLETAPDLDPEGGGLGGNPVGHQDPLAAEKKPMFERRRNWVRHPPHLSARVTG